MPSMSGSTSGSDSAARLRRLDRFVGEWSIEAQAGGPQELDFHLTYRRAG
jgi:hypothetical protein